jgi:hypothetical protein
MYIDLPGEMMINQLTGWGTIFSDKPIYQWTRKLTFSLYMENWGYHGINGTCPLVIKHGWKITLGHASHDGIFHYHV